MNRVIKFRCYYPKSKKMVEWSEMIGLHISAIFQKDSEFQHLMQFIGLKDKNGVEIYEGDIVLLATENNKQKWEVSFFEGCFGFERKNTFITVGYVNHGTDEIEIIGNKFENPKLLEGTK